MMKRKQIPALLATLVALGMFLTVSCKKDKKTTPADPPLTVDYNGFTYHTVKIGEQVWMVENLRTTKYRDGTGILDGNAAGTWQNAGMAKVGAWCKYPDADEKIYGLLYNWYAVEPSGALAGKHLAPEGWHIPSKEDWDELYAHLGGDAAEAGNKMKEEGTENWADPNSGNNKSGFKGLPGGRRVPEGTPFWELGSFGVFWSSSPVDLNEASSFYLSSKLVGSTDLKGYGLSVRCIQDKKP